MHQVHNKDFDDYKGFNKEALRKFGKTCARQDGIAGFQPKRIRDHQQVIIRNKYTKEIVDLEELVGHTTHQRNWRGIIIALVVIIAVCALIIATIILISPNEDDKKNKKKFTFEDFMSGKYSPKTFSIAWVKGEDAFYYRDVDGAVFKYNCSNSSSFMIMDNSTFKELDTSRFTISHDEMHAMLPYEITHLYRHTTIAKYKIFYMSTRSSENLTGPKGLQFQYVSWSPTGNAMVFVQENDIYYRTQFDQSATTRRVTNTGIPNVIYNGIPDWVYEEEVLAQDNAIWWSPSGKYFLFATFNDSMVGEFDMAYYGSPSYKYVETKHIAYPKAGTANPTFRLRIYSTERNTTIDVEPPTVFQKIDHYFTKVSWKDDETVLIIWLNRSQNISIFTVCSAGNGTCYNNYHLESTTGWLDVFDQTPIFTQDGNNYFMLIPQREGDAGYFKHIAIIDATARVDLPNNQLGRKTFLTTGLFDVRSILSYNENEKQVYYIAYKAGDPTSSHLYRTSVDNASGEFRKAVCLSCQHPGICEWVSASFSYTSDYYLLVCNGPGVPTYTLYSTVTDFVHVFEDNEALKISLQELALPKASFVKIPIDDKQNMWGKILRPIKNSDEEEVRYSLLMNVYGGPGSQRVSQSFSLGWEMYLASSHNIVIAYADGRGTAGRGDTWLHSNYRNLGTTEVDDVLTAGKYFKQLGYVTANTAIWGWSYGGFLSASVIGRGTDVFKCGISVAPVTDWRYYDTIYTERYMGLPRPDDNEEAYSFSNISKYANNFKHSRFMIVHGTGDDNVHFQNTAQLVKALTEADVYFRTQIYTDQQHSINGGNSRRHLYRTLEDFLLQCYGSPSAIDEMNQSDSTTKDTD